MVQKDTPEIEKMVTDNVKRVKFNCNDDIAYVYPWSPTKYLLYGKFTEEQLLRKRKKENKNGCLTSILKNRFLKSTDNISLVTDTSDFFCEKTNLNPMFCHYIGDAIESDDFAEDLDNLPVEAIFSPSLEKDLKTNLPVKETSELLNANYRVNSKDIKIKRCRKLPKKKDAFVKVQNNQELINNIPKSTLPYLIPMQISGTPYEKLNGNYDSKIENNLKHMPSINTKIINKVKGIPVTRSQISKRYAMCESDLENIKHLNEEEISIDNRFSTKNCRRTLPSLLSKENTLLDENNNFNSIDKILKISSS